MKNRTACVVFAVAVICPALATAATLEQLQRYDFNENKRIDYDELLILQRHQRDPVLAKYDLNNDLKLDPVEMAKARADLDLYARPAIPQKATRQTAEDVFRRGVEQANAKRKGGIPLEDIAEKPKSLPDPCAPAQSLFIRRDGMDTFLYGITPVSKAQGASLSYANNYLVAGQRTAQIDGQVSLLLTRQPCVKPPIGSDPDKQIYLAGYAVAPWVSGHGNINEQNRSSEKSALKFGVDTQFDVSAGELLDVSYFSGTPYWQTDFRGYARVAGYAAYWEPYRLDLRLGGSSSRFSDVVDWYWRFRGEADIRNVQDAGITNLAVGNYEWFGFTTQAYLFFLPGNLNVPDFLRDRFKVIATFKYYSDARTGDWYSQYSGEAAYNLSSDGSTSLSLQYARGVDKDTLAPSRQFSLKLNYKY